MSDTHAIRRTANPALINPSQAKRKSTELGQSRATQSGVSLVVFGETVLLISVAAPIDPFLNSSKSTKG